MSIANEAHDPSGPPYWRNGGHLPALARREECLSATEWRAPGKEAPYAIHP